MDSKKKESLLNKGYKPKEIEDLIVKATIILIYGKSEIPENIKKQLQNINFITGLKNIFSNPIKLLDKKAKPKKEQDKKAFSE